LISIGILVYQYQSGILILNPGGRLATLSPYIAEPDRQSAYSESRYRPLISSRCHIGILWHGPYTAGVPVDADFRAYFNLLHEDLTRIADELQAHTRLLRAIHEGRCQGQAEYVSIQQAATLTGLSATKIRREVKAGRLPASDAGTPAHPHYRIRKADLNTWLESNRGGRSVPPRVPIVRQKIKSRYFCEM
jgi:excisionase family DNA binding protein